MSIIFYQSINVVDLIMLYDDDDEENDGNVDDEYYEYFPCISNFLLIKASSSLKLDHSIR